MMVRLAARMRATQLLPRTALLIALVSMLALVSACGGGGDKAGSGGTGASGGAASTELTILMKDNVFEPKTVTVPKGAKVTINYENVGATVHNLVFSSKELAGKDFQSPATVQPKEKGKFEATFPKAGEVKFICAYHQPEMTGALTVR